MTTATSQVGIDLNAVASCAWLSTPLQFVPGLGPRKASALLRAVMRVGGFVESRAQVGFFVPLCCCARLHVLCPALGGQAGA
jgi:transcription elongation factor SPT6